MNIKTKLLTLSLLLAAQFASSQVLISLIFGDKLNSDGIEFGLEGGFNYMDIGALQANDRLSGFNLGFYFDIRLEGAWHLYTGVLAKSGYGTKGLTEPDLALLQVASQGEGGTHSQYINSFQLPAFIKYRFPSRIYAEAGPQFGLMYKSWVQFDSDIDGTQTRIRVENKDAINTFDVGGAIGVGYRLKPGPAGMTLGLRYYQGFTNAIKGLSGSRNNALFLKFNIPIGAAKKKGSKTEQ
jgi:hypothetical protein